MKLALVSCQEGRLLHVVGETGYISNEVLVFDRQSHIRSHLYLAAMSLPSEAAIVREEEVVEWPIHIPQLVQVSLGRLNGSLRVNDVVDLGLSLRDVLLDFKLAILLQLPLVLFKLIKFSDPQLVSFSDVAHQGVRIVAQGHCCGPKTVVVILVGLLLLGTLTSGSH